MDLKKAVLISTGFTLFCALFVSSNAKDDPWILLEKRRLRADGKAVEVNTKAFVLDIEEVNCLNMELTVEIYLQHYWHAPSNPENGRPERDPDKSNLKGDWIPDSYVVNSRKSATRKHDVSRNRNGDMEKSEIITVTTKCAMDFSLYPFDHQKCSIELESYSFTTDDVQYKWSESENEEKVVDIDPSAISVLPFEVIKVGFANTNVTYMNETYSRLSIDIHLRRHWNTYLESFYVPMTFFLSLSLLSLWLVYPRISALVNFFNVSLVNIFLQLHQGNSDLPKLYYKTAMTAYSIICYVFIFLTLFLNVYILFYIKTDEDDNGDGSDKKESPRSPSQGISINNIASPGGSRTNIQSYVFKAGQEIGTPSEDPPEPSNWFIIKGRLMDKCRRNAHWTLLSAFLLTKLAYWITLLSMHYSA